MALELDWGRQNVSVVVLDRLAKVLGIEAWRLACASKVRRSGSRLEVDTRPHLEASGQSNLHIYLAVAQVRQLTWAADAQNWLGLG
jgi:hypothetical protein